MLADDGSVVGRKWTRRQVLGLASGLLAIACRRSEPAPSPTSAPTATPAPPALLLTPTATRSQPVSTPAPTATPRPLRRFVRTRLDQPRSHDFNADASCGGEADLFAGLVRLTPDYEVRPDWAEQWEVSADGTRWLFRLRRNTAGWSNGDPIRASDFVWSWRRMLDPARSAPQASLFDVVGHARAIRTGAASPEQLAVRALDDWTLEIELERPAGYLLSILGTPGFFPAHRPSVERWGASWTEDGKCVSNGPFQLLSWERGTGMVLIPNPYYWNRPALALDRCDVLVAPPDTPLLGFFRGRVDLASVPLDQLAAVTSEDDLLDRLERSVLPETWFLIVQPDRPPLDAPEYRRALSQAIDRERLRQLAYGAVEPAQTLVPPGVPGYSGDPAIATLHAFAPESAQRTYADVGEEGRSLQLLAPPARSSVEETVLEDIVVQLTGNLGVRIQLERLEGAEWERAVQQGRFQLLWWRWPLPFPDAAAVYEWLFARERRALSGLRWESTELEQFLDIARRELELSRRLGAYRQCERIIQEALIALPIVYPVTTFLVQPWVVRLPRNRDGMLVAPGPLFSRFLSSIMVQPPA